MLKDDKFITTDLDSRVHSLETVAKVSAAAASILDSEELLQTAADLVKTNFDLYHAHIYLLNAAGDALVLSAGAGEVGKAMKAQGHQIPLNHEHSLVARAAQTRHAITANDVSKDANFLANPLLPLTRSEMAVPMLVGGALVGVLDVQDDTLDRFTDEDARIQTILAEQLAVAIQNAQAFSQLQRAQLESKRMFDNSIDMVGTAGFDGYFKDVNPAWERTLGYTRDELLSAPFISFVHPDDAGPTNSEFEREMAAGSATISFENRYLAKDGSYHWMSWNAVPLLKEGIIYFVTRDITNNKRLEAETTRRANALESIAKVSAAATGILDLNEMLQTVSDLTKASFDLYHAHIYLLDESGKNLYLAAGAGEVGRTLKQRGHQIALNHEHSLVAQCARTHHGVTVNDVTQNPNFLPNPLLPLTHSEMAIPLIVGKKLIGVLDVQSEVVGRFTEDDIRIQTTLGDQIAVVIQNDRTFEERQYLQQETELLYNVANRLSAAKNRHDLLTAVSDYAISRGGTGAALMYFDLDEQGNPDLAEIVAQTDTPNPGLPIGTHLKLSDFEVAKAWIASPETPYLIPNTQDPETVDQPTREIYAMVGQIATAIMPLYLQGHWVGLVQCQWDKPQQFTDQDRRIYAAMGSQLAAVVDAIRSNEALAAAQQESELLYNVASRLSGAKNRQDLLTAVSDYAISRGGAGATLLYFELDTQGNPEWGEIVAQTDMPNPGLPIGARINLTGFEVAKVWMASPETPVLIPNTQDPETIDQPTREIYAMVGQIAVAIMPLYLQGRWVGLVQCQWDKPQQFTDQDRRIYAAMGSQLAAVVDAVRSSEALAAAQHEAELLYNVSRRLSGAKSRQELLTAVSDYAISRGGAGATLLYFDLDEQGNPEWGEVVAEIHVSGEPLPVSARLRLTDFAVAKLWIASPEKPLFIPNTQDPETVDQATREIYTRTQQIGVVIMPLYLQGRWVGLVQCQWDTPQQFTEQDRRIYAAMGSQLAAVVDAVRSSEALTAAQQESELLYNVSRRLSGAKSRHELLTAVSDYAISRGGTGATLLYFELDEKGNPYWGEIVAQTEMLNPGLPIGARLNLTDFEVAKVWMASPETPVLIPDTQDPETIDQATREIYAMVGQIATAIMPLYLQGRWVGLVQCQWDKPQQFTDQDHRIYAAMGSQLAAVVDAVRSSEALQASQRETEQRAAELETVAQVSTTAASVLDIDTLLQTVVDLTKSRFNLYHAHIYLTDADNVQLVLAAGAGEAGHKMKAEGRVITLDNQGSLVARAGRSRQGVIENDVTKAADFLPNPYLPDTRAELAIPMVVADHLVGVLDIQAETANRFEQSDISIMTTLAGQIAVAVRNAQSYQQQVQLVDQLQTIDRLKSEFLASMSHELRTPLNSIIGYSRMLLDGGDGELEEEMAEDMEAIHNSGQHLLHLINDILDLAKIEAERLEIDQEKVEFGAVSEEVTRMTSVLLREKPVMLIQEIDPELPTLWADPIRLRQVLNNLVSNAIKFTEQGEIRITAKQDNGMAVIGVRDTGMGISPDQLERIFERFHQADTSSTRKAGGTGLGLTISRHLVEMHGGSIWAESTLGKGTTFWFSMPTTASVN